MNNEQILNDNGDEIMQCNYPNMQCCAPQLPLVRDAVFGRAALGMY